jgi:uncharacterized protein
VALDRLDPRPLWFRLPAAPQWARGGYSRENVERTLLDRAFSDGSLPVQVEWVGETLKSMRKVARSEAQSDSERTCLVTRTKGSPDAMIRFVVGPDATVVPDIRRKLPGRGVWVVARADKVAEAVRRQAFARGFKTKVLASEALPEQIRELLDMDCLQALALANKAGQVVTGFAKVEDALAKGTVVALVHAREASADGVRKLAQADRRWRGDEAGGTARINLFTSLQLDLALGRTNVIHAALTEGSASRNFAAKCSRLELYCSGPTVETGSPPPAETTEH